jgi:hypothetical protein
MANLNTRLRHIRSAAVEKEIASIQAEHAVLKPRLLPASSANVGNDNKLVFIMTASDDSNYDTLMARGYSLLVSGNAVLASIPLSDVELSAINDELPANLGEDYVPKAEDEVASLDDVSMIELSGSIKKMAAKKANKHADARRAAKQNRDLNLRFLTTDGALRMARKLFLEYVESDDMSTFMEFLADLDDTVGRHRVYTGTDKPRKVTVDELDADDDGHVDHELDGKE